MGKVHRNPCPDARLGGPGRTQCTHELGRDQAIWRGERPSVGRTCWGAGASLWASLWTSPRARTATCVCDSRTNRRDFQAPPAREASRRHRPRAQRGIVLPSRPPHACSARQSQQNQSFADFPEQEVPDSQSRKAAPASSYRTWPGTGGRGSAPRGSDRGRALCVRQGPRALREPSPSRGCAFSATGPSSPPTGPFLKSWGERSESSGSA